MTTPTHHRIAIIPDAALYRPSTALIILQGLLLSYHVSGGGASLTAGDVADICEALSEIVPAIQTLEAAAEHQISATEGQPSADIVIFPSAYRPYALPPSGGDAA